MSEFKIGDRVTYLDDSEGGIITGLVPSSHTMYQVFDLYKVKWDDGLESTETFHTLEPEGVVVEEGLA